MVCVPPGVNFVCALGALNLFTKMLPSSEQGHVALEIQSSLTAFFRLGFSKFYITHKSPILLLLKLKTLCSLFSVLQRGSEKCDSNRADNDGMMSKSLAARKPHLLPVVAIVIDEVITKAYTTRSHALLPH